MDVDTLVERVQAAERGPQVVACFDYDGTLIDGFSAKAFYAHRIRHLEIGPIELARTLIISVQGIKTTEDFDALLELSLTPWRGRPETELLDLGKELFQTGIHRWLFPETWAVVEAHRQMGHTLVLASSATRFQVEPMAEQLGIEHVLCTPLEVVDGIITGKTGGPPLWSERKAQGLVALAQEHELNLDRSFAYSNGTEDQPLLEAVGYPAAINPEPGLRARAEAEGWPVLDVEHRGKRPGLTQIARTVGFYSGFAAAAGVGGALGLLNRSKQTLLEITTGVGADVALSVAGVRVDVLEGQEHLWSSRPCVFVFNHQSNIDPIVIMKLVRENFTGVAKAEAKKIPGFGQFFQLAGVAFVERGNTKQSIDVLKPAVSKVRDEGLSLVIAPEGTRSYTPKLGRFKKGAFHIAMQAEVPMVPIALRHAGSIMPRGQQTIRPGRIEVVVLPPVDTSEWTTETLDDHVADVRGMIQRALIGEPQPSQMA
jgi:putative phosphoserine phosphatase/1-acylglycerol-3-phosphate O-acyltransferase